MVDYSVLIQLATIFLLLRVGLYNIQFVITVNRSETACCKLISEVRNYRDSIKEVQEAEEKLLKDLGASGLGAVSPQLQQASDEYLSVVIEVI